MTRKYDYKGNCTGANGFSVLAEGLGVIILRTYASCGRMSFGGKGVCLKGYLGIDSRVARSSSLEVTLLEDLRD